MGRRWRLWACVALAANICGLLEVTVAQCTAPALTADNVDTSTANTAEGATTTFTCNEGYEQTEGSLTLLCNSGTWTWQGGDTPTCADIDECDPDPCQNRGTCTDGVNDYSCACVPGYNGKNCNNNIDECASTPCQNGATCYDGVNGYTCTCAPTYIGTNCETEVVAPASINIRSVTEGSIEITWPPATSPKDSYSISLSPAHGTSHTGSVDDGDPLEYTFTGLTAGTLYTISVTTVSGGVSSVAREKTQRTTVAQPGAISILQAEVAENTIRITWTAAAGAKDSYDISISPDTGVANPTGNVAATATTLEYTFTRLTAGTLYTISVITDSGGSKSVAREDTQRTTVAQPGDIAIESADVTETSIRITWAPAAGAVDTYSISLSAADGDNPTGSVNAATLEYTFTGLIAGTLYTISVTTVSGDNSVPRTTMHRTTVDQPGVITIDPAEVTETRIRITWTEADGAKDKYDISISPDTNVNNPTGSVNTGATLEYTFNDLTAGILYTISVITDSGGDSSVVTTKQQRTRPLAPTNIAFSESGIDPTTQINVSWEPSQTSCVDEYSLTYETSNMDVTAVDRPDSSTMSEFISGLLPGTLYTIRVIAICDGNVESGRLEGVRRTQADKPTDLQESSANTTAVTVTWLGPTTEGRVDGYIVSYKAAGESGSESTIRIDDKAITETTIANLTAGELYDVEVVSFSGQTQSQSASEQFRTIPNTPGDIARPADDMVTTTDIPITWEPTVGGVWSGYEVIYTAEGGEALIAVPVNNETTSASSLVDLVPGRQYNIEVYAVSEAGGTRKISDNKTITVRTFPELPKNLQSTVVEKELRIDLSWDKPVGDVDTYQVNVVRALSVVETTNTTNTTASIHKLLANTAYRFYVYSISGKRRSKEAADVTNTTDKAAPPAIQDPTPPAKPTSTGTTGFSVPLDRSVFNTDNGNIEVYSILVQAYNAEKSPNEVTQSADILTWGEVTKPPESNPDQQYKFYKAVDVSGSTSRRRRNVGDPILIGADPDCNDTSIVYCNGPLKPNTQYRYIIQGCTQGCEGGPCTPQNKQDLYYCTRTIVSEPVRTAAEQNITPIIVGVVVAVVLLAIIAGVIFWYRRRKKDLPAANGTVDRENRAFAMEEYSNNQPKVPRVLNKQKYMNIKKKTTTGRNDVPLSDITSKEYSEIDDVDNDALSVSEADSKSYRRLSEIRTVDDVTKFLKENNFGEYAKVFKDHDVDGDALQYIDDAILKDLVPKAGPRAKLKGILAKSKQEKPSEVSQVTALNFWEIPRTGLKLGKRLGSGQFGEVRLGELRNRGVTSTVAVKTLRDSASDSDKKDLLGELEILVTVGRHDNIISLVGACTRDGPLMIVVEYAPNGCLKDWLKTNSVENSAESAYQNQPVYASQIPMEQLIQFGVDVANGMSHLAAMQCVHRDLAARNILLGENIVAKVSDFGLSRDIYEDSEYVKSTQSKLPLRWMAYESLFYNVYTTQSDVWSFGVLLWEIMASGNLPYEGMKGKRMMDMIKDGGRLEKPGNCPAEIYTLMTRCWETLPEDKPTFRELRSSLIRIMQEFKTYASLLK